MAQRAELLQFTFISRFLSFGFADWKRTQPRRWIVPLFLAASITAVASAQVAPGMPNFSAFDSHEVDTVNLMNNNIVLLVPVMSKSGAMGFNYALTGGSYESVVSPSPKWQASMASLSLGGPLRGSASGVVAGGITSYATPLVSQSATCPGGGSTTKFMNWVVVFVDGTVHPLPPTDYIDTYGANLSCLNASFTDTTTDGSGYTVNVTHNGPASIYNRSGMSISASSVTDSNGNSISASGSGTYTLRDTLGLTAITTYELSAPASTYTWTDVNGGSPEVAATSTGPITLRSAFGCSGISDYNQSGAALQSGYTFPDGTSLGLTYETTPGYSPDVTGRIKTITLREGGTVTYTYGGTNNGINCTYQTVPVLTRTLGNGDVTTYTLAYSIIGGGPGYQATNTVIDPGGNKTVYTFTGFSSTGVNSADSQLMTQVQHYQGANTLLTTDVYCYNGLTSNCATATMAAGPITAVDVYHTLSGMSTSSRTETQYDAYGNVTDYLQFGFGAASPTRQTFIFYGSWNGSTCVPIGNNINDKPCERYVDYDVNEVAKVVSTTLFTYDSHGNLTSTSFWTGNGSTYIGQTTANAYNPNGTPSTTYDVANNRTTYSYNPSSYAHCGSCTQYPFPTSISKGGLTISSTWDGYGGVKLTDTDANSNTTTYGYGSDPFNRATSIQDPMGNTVHKTYPSSSLPDTVNSSFTFNSGNSIQNVTQTTDGYGRPLNTQTQQSPTATQYDTVSYGYVWAFTGEQNVDYSEPCSTTLGSLCSEQHVIRYDALGRLDYETTANNEYVPITYSQNDKLRVLNPAPAGENTKQVQTEYDGLGRPTKSCAIGNGSTTPCGQNTGTQNGVTTSVSYTAGTGATAVSLTRGAQTRSQTYDALGRVTSTVTPEGGTWYYYYDIPNCNYSAASPGNMTCSVDPNGITTLYFYDSLNRLTDVNAVTSFCRRYRYDNSGGVTGTIPSGITIANQYGRLVEAATDNCVAPFTLITDEWFSYDKDGRVTDVWELTPHSGGYYHTTAVYFGNGAVQAVSGIPGVNGATYGLDGEGRPNTGSFGTTSIIYGSGVAYNAAGQPTTVPNMQGDSDAYQYDSNTGRMTNYTFTVNGVSASGALTWNPNGTLLQFSTTDNINPTESQTCNFGGSIAGYDDLGRLISDNCSPAWSQSFSYDQYDNVTKSGSISWNPGYNAANSHYSSIGATYDPSGNVTYDTFNTYTWDGYQKVASVNPGHSTASCGTSGWCLTYDALGRMVELNASGTYSEILYSPIGKTAIMNGQTVTKVWYPMPGGGTVLASSTNWPHYEHVDWLGSARLQTEFSGTLGNSARTVDYDRSFAPYGEMYGSTGNDAYDLDFTGDVKTMWSSGLLDTPNREYHPNQGRWISPDPAPAGWNQYAYATNPNSFTDPLGLAPGACKVARPMGQGGGCNEGQTNYGGGFIDALSGWFSNFDQFFTNGTVGADGGYISPGDPLGPPVDSANTGDDGTTAANNGPQKACPAVPAHPANANVNSNISLTNVVYYANWLNPPTQAAFTDAWLVSQVRPNGPWDYKTQGQQYDAFGNFNFGATGGAAGIPLQVLQAGAGAVSALVGTNSSQYGSWYQPPLYGHAPIKSDMIAAGYAYYQQGCK